MSINTEIERYKQLNEKVKTVRDLVAKTAEKFNIEIEKGVDDVVSVLEKIKSKEVGGGTDRFQWKCDNVKKLYYEFYQYGGDNLDILKGLDTSNVTNMRGMFRECKNLVFIPEFDTSNVFDMSLMFYQCYNLENIPNINTSKATNMDSAFRECQKVKTITHLNTSKVTNMMIAFYACTALESVSLDMVSVTSTQDMFSKCTAMKNLTLKNIKSTLTIGKGDGSGTFDHGYLLTVDSLINTIKELWDFSSLTATPTLTMGTANTAKLADVYVKLVDVTEEMLANDPYADQKMPCEVCASTDEGAMLITSYATLKRWTIA